MNQNTVLNPIDRVRQFLASSNRNIEIREFTVDTSTSATAAVALGVEPAQIAKSILFKSGDQLGLVVTCGDMKVDGKRLASLMGVKKVSLADPDTVLNETGYAIGGVCPFDIRQGVRIFLDTSMRRFQVVYAAAGTPASAVPVTFSELIEITGGQAADVCIAR